VVGCQLLVVSCPWHIRQEKQFACGARLFGATGSNNVAAFFEDSSRGGAGYVTRLAHVPESDPRRGVTMTAPWQINAQVVALTWPAETADEL